MTGVTGEAARRGAAAVAALALLTGCSTHGEQPRATHRTARHVTSSPPPARSAPPAVPSPGSTAEPATTSGSLSKASFPTPKQLGAGWRYAVDPGSAEEGYSGNGTPALARDPGEIVATAVPFGCPRPAAMPAPRHALEVDYRRQGAKVVAVRGRFSDASVAAAFFRGRASNLRGCSGRRPSAAIGPLVSHLHQIGATGLVSDRTPRSDPWHEVAVLDGDTVALVAVHGARPLTSAQTRRLVRLLHS